MDKVLDQLGQPHQEKKHELFRETLFFEALKRDFSAKFEMKILLSKKYRHAQRPAKQCQAQVTSVGDGPLKGQDLYAKFGFSIFLLVKKNIHVRNEMLVQCHHFLGDGGKPKSDGRRGVCYKVTLGDAGKGSVNIFASFFLYKRL